MQYTAGKEVCICETNLKNVGVCPRIYRASPKLPIGSMVLSMAPGVTMRYMSASPHPPRNIVLPSASIAAVLLNRLLDAGKDCSYVFK